MKSRRPVNSDVMQLILNDKRLVWTTCLTLVVVLSLGACHKVKPPAARVSLCDLYEHPAAYDGKLITVAGTVTRFADGTYVFPQPASIECNCPASVDCSHSYAYVKLDADQIQNSSLADLQPPAVSFGVRKEFDLELTGTFDSKYSEPWDHFRFRIVALEIRPTSSVRIGKPLGAA